MDHSTADSHPHPSVHFPPTPNVDHPIGRNNSTRRPLSAVSGLDVVQDGQPNPSDAVRSRSPSSMTTRRKHVRSSVDSHSLNRNSGSPLNPNRPQPRHVSSSVAQGKRRAQDDQDAFPDFRHVSTSHGFYDMGMGIFQDHRSSGNLLRNLSICQFLISHFIDPILDSQIADLQRRARELGPVPLSAPLARTPSPPNIRRPPTFHLNSGPTNASTSTAPASKPLPRSLDSYGSSQATSSTAHSLLPPLSLSHLSAPTPIPRSPSPTTTSPQFLNTPVSAIPSSPSPPKKHGKNTSLVSHLLSDLMAKGKGKFKDVPEDPQAEDTHIREAGMQCLTKYCSIYGTNLLG